MTFSLCKTCPANYYLNFFFYICVVGHLDMCASRYHTDASFIFSTQRALHNSLKKFQNPKRTILWSHILVTNLVTLVIPAIHSSWPHSSSLLNRFLSGVTGEFHKLKHNIFKAQSILHKLQKSWPKTKYHNTSECIIIWHACSKPSKLVHAKY